MIIDETKSLASITTPKSLDELALQAKKETGVNVLITKRNISPFAFELLNKYIVLSNHLFSELNEKQLCLVLEHEITHIKRHDNRLMLFTHIIDCFLWFNPFIDIFQRKMNWAAEISCDDQVLSNKPNLRKAYAVAMLKTLHKCATESSNDLVASFSHQNKRSINMRITNIINFSNKNFKLNHKKIKLTCFCAVASLTVIVAKPSFGEASKKSINMTSPLNSYEVSSKFGSTKHREKTHKGIDLKAAAGSNIKSIQSGRVLVSSDSMVGKEAYGTTIIIDHGNGIQSLYAHMSQRLVEAGEAVKMGQLIGKVGNTGKSSGPHLHLELIENNIRINPAEKIKF